jgi:Ca2+-binding RTX toxin-like protein
VIAANLGNDTLFGDDGNDRLWALAIGDVRSGPGGGVDQSGDTVHGGNGDDVIHTRDGEVDRVDCGPGHDVALLDMVDVIADATTANPNGSCEVVRRHAPNPNRFRLRHGRHAGDETDG